MRGGEGGCLVFAHSLLDSHTQCKYNKTGKIIGKKCLHTSGVIVEITNNEAYFWDDGKLEQK